MSCNKSVAATVFINTVWHNKKSSCGFVVVLKLKKTLPQKPLSQFRLLELGVVTHYAKRTEGKGTLKGRANGCYPYVPSLPKSPGKWLKSRLTSAMLFGALLHSSHPHHDDHLHYERSYFKWFISSQTARRCFRLSSEILPDFHSCFVFFGPWTNLFRTQLKWAPRTLKCCSRRNRQSMLPWVYLTLDWRMIKLCVFFFLFTNLHE